MEGPILPVNNKETIESGLVLILQAAVKTRCYEITEHLIGLGVDVNSASTSVYHKNKPLFMTTKIRNIANTNDLFKCSIYGVENYELNLIPLYICGDNASSKIINIIVNNETDTGETNILSENKSNLELLASKSDEEIEEINKLISKYTESKGDKIKIQHVVDFEKNYNHFLKKPCPFKDFNFAHHDIISEECEYDYIFKNYKYSIIKPLDITDLNLFEHINSYHDLSKCNYWLGKLKALHSNFIIDCTPNINKLRGLFMIFTPLAIIDQMENLTSCSIMENYTPLHIAAEEGCEKMCKLLLNKGAYVMATSKNNNTPLHLAASKGHVRIVNLLLEHAADVNSKNAYNVTPLHFAAFNGNEEICTALLNKGTNIDVTTLSCNTPLHFAVWKGHQQIVKLFLDYGANVNMDDIDGTTAFHFATYKGNENIVHMLLEKGAYVNAPTKYHNTPLHFAAYKGHANILKYLLENGADITKKDTNGVTALHLAAFTGNKKICLDLLNKGADVNAPTYCKLTPIHFAACNNDEKVIKLISEHCSDINIKDDFGRTALHLATRHNNVNAVIALLESGENIYIQALTGVTALHIAVKEGFSKIVKLFLSNGDLININLSNGLTSFHLVSKYSTHWLRFFIDCLKKLDVQTMYCFHVVVYYFIKIRNYFKIVELLLNSGVDVNQKLENGYTYIQHIFVSWENFCTVLEDIEHCDNYPIIGFKNYTEKFIKTLLNYGPNINCLLLHKAMKLNNFAIATLLLEYGADINVIDEDGKTAFECFKISSPLELEREVWVAQNFYSRFAAKQLCRINAAGTQLNRRNFILFLTYRLHRDCTEEIFRMETDYISKDITMYDILTKPLNELSFLAKKIDIVNIFQSEYFEYKYPVYINTLKRRTELAQENKTLRKYLINSVCIRTLEKIFPALVAIEILKFLNVLDLVNLMKALHTPPDYILLKWYERYNRT